MQCKVHVDNTRRGDRKGFLQVYVNTLYVMPCKVDIGQVGIWTGSTNQKTYVNHYVKHPGLDVGPYT